MSKDAENAIEIEPLTKEEQKERGTASREQEKNPEYPKEWLDKGVPVLVDKGFKYYKRTTRDGRIYMILRKKRNDRGLGLWSEEKEGKLFHFFPNLEAGSGIVKPPPWVSQGVITQPKGRAFAAVPISRVAIIPRDYIPSINVIRYFQIVKEQGFPSDFSSFINGVVARHFEHCNGIKLPVVLEGDIELRREEDGEQTLTTE